MEIYGTGFRGQFPMFFIINDENTEVLVSFQWQKSHLIASLFWMVILTIEFRQFVMLTLCAANSDHNKKRNFTVNIEIFFTIIH